MSSSTTQPTERGDKDSEDVEGVEGGPDDKSVVAFVASRKTRRGGKDATALLRGSLNKVGGRAAKGTASGWMWTQSVALLYEVPGGCREGWSWPPLGGSPAACRGVVLRTPKVVVGLAGRQGCLPRQAAALCPS